MVRVVMKPSGMSCYSVTSQTLLPSFPFPRPIFPSNTNNLSLTLIFPLHSLPPFTENLMRMQDAIQTAAELLQISPTDPRFAEKLGYLRTKVSCLTLPLSQIEH